MKKEKTLNACEIVIMCPMYIYSWFIEQFFCCFFGSIVRPPIGRKCIQKKYRPIWNRTICLIWCDYLRNPQNLDLLPANFTSLVLANEFAHGLLNKNKRSHTFDTVLTRLDLQIGKKSNTLRLSYFWNMVWSVMKAQQAQRS